MTTNLRKTTYVPAIGGIQTTKSEINNPKRFWWTKGKSAFFYPMFLVSYSYKSGDLYDNLRERWEVSDDVWILGDSGGFSRISVGDTVDPMKVLRWAELNGINSQISLDFPPYKMGVGQQFGAPLTRREYEKRRNTSNFDANLMFEKREREDLEIYGVVQGENYKDAMEWYRGLIKDHDFPAHALSPKPSDSPEKIATYVALAIENFPDKNIHFLQVSGKNTLPIVTYAKKYLKGRITADTATYAQGRINRTILCSHNFPKWYNIKSDNYLKKYEQPFLPCNCPACAEIDGFENMGQTEIGQWLSLHNLFHLVQFSAFLEGYQIYDEEEFKKYIKKECIPGTTNAFNVIDKVAEGMDVEKAIQQEFYKHGKISDFK